MREISIIGIGPGGPEHLTFAAARELASLDYAIFLDKGPSTDDMRVLRAEILATHSSSSVRTIEVYDPPRDAALAQLDYQAAVHQWHEGRAARLASAIVENCGTESRIGFLVWGDPALYDSTLRVVNQLGNHGVLAKTRVIPGISAVAALTAAFHLPLNRIGEPILITTGRQLAHTDPVLLNNAVVMLDGLCTFDTIAREDLTIYWGAYLGSDSEKLISGPLREVADHIKQLRSQLREQRGWIMDTYLLRGPVAAV